MKLLDTLLDRAVAVLPARLHDGVIVFGSAPMVFAGLKPDVTFDLDLFASEDGYRGLLDCGFTEDHDERGLPRIMVAEGVEVVSAWPGVDFGEVHAKGSPREGSRGLRVAALEHVLVFKTISPRDKDQREADVVRGALAEVGLCLECVHCRRIESAKGSTFRRCQLHESDARFAKYPRLPVLRCDGYARE